MGMTVSIGLPTKPNKSPVAAIAKASGLAEKEDPGNYIWVFQKKTIRIMLEDMRESVKVDREWCDEVGWIHNWAIVISIASNRTETDYQNWIALISLISSSHGASYLHFDEGTGDPTTRWKITEFINIPVLHSEDGSEKPSQHERVPIKPTPVSSSTSFEEETTSGNIQDLIRRELEKMGKVAPTSATTSNISENDGTLEEPPFHIDESLDVFDEDEDESDEDEDEDDSFDTYQDWDL